MNKTLFIVPLILLSLLTAIWAGWLRLGWSLPVSVASAQHGALMTCSFLASLIILERAVTFKHKSMLLLPTINALSVLFFILQQPVIVQWCLLTGSLGFVGMCSYFIYKYRELYYTVFLAGAVCLFAGTVILYLTNSYPHVVPWWIAFLLFTIVAERLELSRFLVLNRWKRNGLLAALAFTLVSLLLPATAQGSYWFAASLVAVAAWLLKYDMAWRSVKVPGQHRYAAVLLITGYVWLLITAAFFFTASLFSFSYDAALHSFFIGFVFSMIFSHAPIILPAILKKPIKVYQPVLYVWFYLLQTSLILRMVGDVSEKTALRRWGGLLNGVVMLLFFATIAVIILQQLHKRTLLRNP